MCAVVGYIGEYDDEIVHALLRNSRIRGLHGFGYTIYDKATDTFDTQKFNRFGDFVGSLTSKRPTVFIAHIRYSTSGSPDDLNTNQPLSNKRNFLAFNGVISQLSIQEMRETFDCEIPHENDGYILMNRWNDESFLRNPAISYAALLLTDNTLTALRNENRPLYQATGVSQTIFASTQDILSRSNLTGVQLKPHIKHNVSFNLH